jgi:outer membrane protein assembly factor BamA
MKRLLLALAPALLAAQSAPPAPPILELRVDGNAFYTPAQTIAASGLKVGDLATKANFERARDRLLATGFFEGFGWRYEPIAGQRGVRATLQVNEPDQFLPWMLDRVPQVERAAFFAWAQKEMPLFGEKIPPTDKLLDRAARILESLAAEKGQKTPMKGRVLLVGTNQIVIVFGPQAPPPNIAAVRFVGARIIPAVLLVKSLHSVAVGQPYIEANFRLFLEHQIHPMYEAFGRLRVTFPKVETEPAPGGNGVIVTTYVEEGPSYTLGRVSVQGAPLSDGEIENDGQFKTDQTVNYSELGKGMQRILEHIRERGYMKASYSAHPTIDEEKKVVNIRIDVDPGPRYTFGKLLIKGLDIETEPVVRKLWGLKPGESFRHGYADEFLTRIRNGGLFDNLGPTTAEEKVDEKSLSVDVTLIFKGEPPKPKEKPRPPEW